MSRPGSLPPAADHEQHDALLVAQLVAGDALQPAQAAEARRLVAGCGACAALAADLPAVSRAVAQEPVPPRRRDFRLSPAQAEGLRGNALTRLMRRLSWPSSRAFQPVAAGVLSIGLLFVVAGYAWPENGTVVVQAEPNLVDRSTTASALPAASARPAGEPAAPLAAPELDAAAALEGAERLMEDPAFADTLAESQAGLSNRAAQKSSAGDAPAEAGMEADMVAEAREPEALLQSLPEAGADDGEAELGAVADTLEEAVTEGTAGSGADDTSAYLADESAADARSEAVVAGADADLATVPDEGGPEVLFLVLGSVLALGGFGLLMLGWLARRTRDPLAP